MSGNWTLKGYDTFDSKFYLLQGEYPNQVAAEVAAQERFTKLEKSQPTSGSGGQDGIQDQVYIVRPDGSQYRVYPRS